MVPWVPQSVTNERGLLNPASQTFAEALPSLSLSTPTAAAAAAPCSLQSLLAARLGEITTSNIALYLRGDKGKCHEVVVMHAR